MTDERDATDLLHRYRECSRGLWNNFMRSPDPDSAWSFNKVCETIFEEIVLAPLGRRDFERKVGEPIPRAR